MSLKPQNNYLVTFFTHSGAIKYKKMLQNEGSSCTIMPVPRSLSSSCGVCITFSRNTIKDIVSTDIQSIYLVIERNNYSLIYSTD
ncbi:MAG: DUF3343 domain-containing protein [Proteocatella sp.]